MKKRLILVTGPVCSGKTTVALNLARNIPNCFYFDKDSLVTLSNVVFDETNNIRDRHSDYFKKAIRNPEYDVTDDVIEKALRFNDTIIVNAPYTSEIYAEEKGENPRITKLRTALERVGGELIIVFISITGEELFRRIHSRMEKSKEDFERDKAAMNGGDDEHIWEYVHKQKISVPVFKNPARVEKLVIFDGKDMFASFYKLLNELGYDRKFDYTVNTNEFFS